MNSIGLSVFGTDFALLDAGERVEQVKRLLAQLRVLVVWDNFETVREMPDPAGATPPLDASGCAGLREFLEWVRDHSVSSVIVTSRAREDWLGQVRRIEVGGLNRLEAAEYAGHLLAPYPAGQRRREQRSFGDLLEWLDGHPLAMRLTLPLLEETGPAELLAGLRGTAPLPVADDPEAGRTTSLAACITYSWAHLPESARRLLPVVSLFHGVADASVLTAMSAAEGVPGRFAGVDLPEWQEVLEQATRVGLLTGLGAGMYKIHPALPGYLAAGWRASHPAGFDEERQAGERVLRAVYAVFGRWLTGQIESGNAALAYAVLGLEHRTLTAMLGHALDQHAWSEASGIVRALDHYWDTRGLRAEADAWADRVLAATTDPDQTPAQAARSLWLHTTNVQADRQRAAGQPGQAEKAYERALAYLHDQPATEWTRASIAVTYHQLGVTAETRGLLDLAEDWYRQSLAISEDLGNRQHMAGTYHQLGVTAQARGLLDQAEDWYRQSLAIHAELGNRPGMATTYHQLGVTAQARGLLDQAEDWYRQSLAISEELGNRPFTAGTFHNLGVIAQARGLLDQAEDWYRQSLAIKEELGNRPGMADTYHQLGVTAQLRGLLGLAEDWYRQSLAIKEELGNRPGMASTYHQLGMIAQARGLLDQAEDWCRQSLAISEELGNHAGMALTYAQLGLLAEKRDQAPLALEWNIRCVTLFDEFPSPLTGTGPTALARLTHHLGLPALETTWHQIAGQPLPQHVRDYLTSHPDQPPGATP